VAGGADESQPRQLPRGRHGLPRAFVVENQRERMLDAMAEVTAAKGYGDVTVADIIEHARVSRRTFYENFADKEECFNAAYDAIVDRIFEHVIAAFSRGEGGWPQRMGRGLSALVDVLVAEPAFARLSLVDVLAVGRSARERRDHVIRQFTMFLEPGRDELPPGSSAPAELSLAVVGGIYDIAYFRILHDELDELPGLVPDLLYCVLLPYVGHKRALTERERLRACRVKA
jgi:AcrR family transcriptional regulator